MVKKMTMEDGTRNWFSCDSELTRESRKKILYFEWREYILSSENYANPFRISQIILQDVFVRVTRMCKFCFKIILFE